MAALLPLRPSGLYRSVFGCPGSRRVEAAIPPGPPSEYALLGQVAHLVAEELLRSRGDPAARTPAEMLGSAVSIAVTADGDRRGDVPGTRHVVDRDMMDAVLVYVAECDRLLDAAIAGGDPVAGLEQWLPMPWLGGGRGGGTADCVVGSVSARWLAVRDYKHGVGVYVHHEDNPQLLSYAAGALRQWRVDLELPDPDIIDVGIVQPRYAGAAPIRSVRYTPGQLDAWVAEFPSHVALTEAPDAPLRPGDHCRFCAAKPSCFVHAQHRRENPSAGRSSAPPPPPTAQEETPSWLPR